MGVDLSNKTGDLYFNWFNWNKLLELAFLYGWKPIGTVDPTYYELDDASPTWDGSYFLNEGQTVLDEDAQAIAHALEKALLDIPDPIKITNPSIKIEDVSLEKLNSQLQLKAVITAIIDAEHCGAITNDPLQKLLDEFSGQRKVLVENFIKFCRGGGFGIW